jgi:hypothetical protein
LALPDIQAVVACPSGPILTAPPAPPNDPLPCQLFELLLTLSGSSRYQKLLAPALPELAALCISYSQMSSGQEETWVDDPNALIADEETEFVGCRCVVGGRREARWQGDKLVTPRARRQRPLTTTPPPPRNTARPLPAALALSLSLSLNPPPPTPGRPPSCCWTSWWRSWGTPRWTQRSPPSSSASQRWGEACALGGSEGGCRGCAIRRERALHSRSRPRPRRDACKPALLCPLQADEAAGRGAPRWYRLREAALLVLGNLLLAADGVRGG